MISAASCHFMIDDRGRPSNLVKCCSRLITPNCLNDSHFSHDPLSSDDLVVKMSRTGAPRCYWHVTSHSCSRCYVAPGMTTRIFPLRLCTWQSRGASSDRLSGGGIRALEFIQETSEPLKSRLFFFFFYKRRLQAYQFGAIWQFCTPSDRSQEETECQMSLKHYPEWLSCGVGCVDLYFFSKFEVISLSWQHESLT